MATPITSNRDPKTCTKCGEEKPLAEFYRIYTKYGRPVRVPLYQSRCKRCCIAKMTVRTQGPKRAEILAYRQRHYQRLKAEGRANLGWRDRHFDRSYNTTQAAYDLQITAQNGRCAVCNRIPAEGETRFAFDHDHETGLTRGVLCSACNGGLGCFRDDPVRLRAALTYLEEWGQQHAAKKAANE